MAKKEIKYHITMCSVDEEGDECKCDFHYKGSDALAVFEKCRKYHVEGSHGWDFMMDLHSDEESYIGNPITFKREHFKEITGQEPKTHEEYREFDVAYWSSLGWSQAK